MHLESEFSSHSLFTKIRKSFEIIQISQIEEDNLLREIHLAAVECSPNILLSIIQSTSARARVNLESVIRHRAIQFEFYAEPAGKIGK